MPVLITLVRLNMKEMMSDIKELRLSLSLGNIYLNSREVSTGIPLFPKVNFATPAALWTQYVSDTWVSRN